MTKENILNNNWTSVNSAELKKTESIILLDEFEKDKSDKLVQLRGKLTSNIHSRKSSDTPYYAFLRLDNSKHSLAECVKSKCQECDLPVIFRLKETTCQFHSRCSSDCRLYKGDWQNPNLNKGEKVLLQGQWAKSDHSQRPSFTCYSYQIL